MSPMVHRNRTCIQMAKASAAIAASDGDDGYFQCNGLFSLNGKRKKMAKPERMILIVKSSECVIIFNSKSTSKI